MAAVLGTMQVAVIAATTLFASFIQQVVYVQALHQPDAVQMLWTVQNVVLATNQCAKVHLHCFQVETQASSFVIDSFFVEFPFEPYTQFDSCIGAM
jgi:hypothetical protein